MTLTGTSASAFGDFEKIAWVKMAPHYDAIAGQVTRQATSAVLEAAAIHPGELLLDIATGPGYVAAAAAQRGARSIGLDFSPDMIAEARRSFPDLHFDEGDAESLPYENDRFDAAVCAFGMLHFPRPGRAVAEAHRVLRPGRRMVFSSWCSPVKTRLFGFIREAMERHADMTVAQIPAGPGAFMFGDPLFCTAVMDAAGFDDVQVSEITCQFRVRTPEDIVTFLHRCSPRVVPLFEAQTPAIRARIEQELLDEGTRAIARDGGVVPCPVLVVSGAKKAG